MNATHYEERKMEYDYRCASVSELVGKTLKSVERMGDEEIIFTAENGLKFSMHHNQSCCENVYIESVVGDLQDLVGSPILQAEEASNDDTPPPSGRDPASYTWTFYKFATIKGYVDIRWFGSSNGWYSEAVGFYEIKAA